jgi:hypothetical protein
LRPVLLSIVVFYQKFSPKKPKRTGWFVNSPPYKSMIDLMRQNSVRARQTDKSNPRPCGV